MMEFGFLNCIHIHHEKMMNIYHSKLSEYLRRKAKILQGTIPFLSFLGVTFKDFCEKWKRTLKPSFFTPWEIKDAMQRISSIPQYSETRLKVWTLRIQIKTFYCKHFSLFSLIFTPVRLCPYIIHILKMQESTRLLEIMDKGGWHQSSLMAQPFIITLVTFP